jgi:hypothetical protein
MIGKGMLGSLPGTGSGRTCDERVEHVPEAVSLSYEPRMEATGCGDRWSGHGGLCGRRIRSRLRPEQIPRGDSLPEDRTVEVSYKITGAEDPIEGTFFITLDDQQVEGRDDELASTRSSSAKLKIKITDVEYDENR